MICGDQVVYDGQRKAWNNFESQREKTADLESG